jgi:kynurenine formamidase
LRIVIGSANLAPGGPELPPAWRFGMCVPGCQEAVRHALSRRGFFKGALAASFGATAVAPEIAGAAPARSFTSVVDLTHTMSPDFPTFFGVPGIEMDKKFDLKKDGFNLYWWRIVEHAGTHLDAPIHFSEAGATAEKISADTLVVPLAVVDVAAKAAHNPDYLLTVEDLADWEKRHQRLPDNCCVAMQSGWAQHVGNPAKFTGKDGSGVFHFPGVGPQAAEWLMNERSVVGLAVDTLSLDHGPSKDFKVHYAWLPSGRWGLENVANLDKVPPSGAMLVVGLAKVKDATGGPARLIALV